MPESLRQPVLGDGNSRTFPDTQISGSGQCAKVAELFRPIHCKLSQNALCDCRIHRLELIGIVFAYFPSNMISYNERVGGVSVEEIEPPNFGKVD